MAKKASTIDVTEFVSHYPRPIQQVVASLRRLIQKSVPDLSEAVAPDLHFIRFRVTEGQKSHYFCHLAPFDDHVRLGFEYGALLADPEHLLMGKGKRARHVIFSKSSDIRPEDLEMMVAEAALVAVNRGHAIV
jgi:hypothetical protein